MYCLGIESSCDETAAAVVKDGKEILSNIVFSQMRSHQRFGGVVPELASREHIERIIPTIDTALKEANLTLEDIDLIAATKGPGLLGALLVGLNTAKGLALCTNTPFVGVNHIEAHLYAALMDEPKEVTFPCLGVIISGGHTSLVLMKDLGTYEEIGATVDDAVGEAFDKAAVLMGLPYPGGPEIEKLALEGDPNKFKLKAGRVKNKPLHFSFSGLKTAMLYALKGPKANKHSANILAKEAFPDLAASFQQAAFTDIIKKTFKAAEKYQISSIIFGGGVSQSQTLRSLFESYTQDKFQLVWPNSKLCLDNAAMIAGLGCHQFLHSKKADALSIKAENRLKMG
ncbi:MAG: tRNA (adenosine(37)-N6)-threonylcarbamoyltransferase complex transferase subunit TsaD [Chlamydiales bacterium]|nr:tRNA (adenosine(37)-N6)-threonylcarbamoyltransferase complex transferase subunit TsaD [Chlamydiales bacterium]